MVFPRFLTLSFKLNRNILWIDCFKFTKGWFFATYQNSQLWKILYLVLVHKNAFSVKWLIESYLHGGRVSHSSAFRFDLMNWDVTKTPKLRDIPIITHFPELFPVANRQNRVGYSHFRWSKSESEIFKPKGTE